MPNPPIRKPIHPPPLLHGHTQKASTAWISRRKKYLLWFFEILQDVIGDRYIQLKANEIVDSGSDRVRYIQVTAI